jgi:hypothetical protein
MSNTSREVFSDVITGKGGGLVRTFYFSSMMILESPTRFQIALLHGPPGTGKTLTAEAVAEHLKRPLYVLSSLELSTTPATLEKKLGDILRVRKPESLLAAHSNHDAIIACNDMGRSCPHRRSRCELVPAFDVCAPCSFYLRYSWSRGVFMRSVIQDLDQLVRIIMLILNALQAGTECSRFCCSSRSRIPSWRPFLDYQSYPSL